jgi:RNA methyltransferase, TrmH family
MPVRTVESKHNARLKELRKALARPASGPAGSNLVGIEGPNLVAEALRAGLRIQCVFAAQGAEKLIETLHLPSETEILLLPKPLLDAALTTETPQPVAALIEPPDWTWAHLFSGHSRASLILILAGLQDPGNLGTIIRSAEAFGATGIVSLPGTVSAWNPKAVRASAGSVFRVPVIAADERSCFGELREAGVKVLATVVRKAELDVDLDMTGPSAIIIGNEGSGVPDGLAARADARITISCPGPVESLNAAVATSVLLYEASRQRMALAGGPYDRRGARR